MERTESGTTVSEQLVADATRRSGLVWLQPAGSTAARPVWHLWHGGCAYVLTGGEEQPDPGLQAGGRALVVVPGERQGDRVVQWWADVTVVEPGSAQWAQLTPLLSAARLNARDVAGQRERWARGCVLFRLCPDGTGRDPDDSGYLAPPLPTPATTDRS